MTRRTHYTEITAFDEGEEGFLRYFTHDMSGYLSADLSIQIAPDLDWLKAIEILERVAEEMRRMGPPQTKDVSISDVGELLRKIGGTA